MTQPDVGDGAPILRPRTIRPGSPDGRVTVLRPRTIGALGRPSPIPIPPIATSTGGAWEPPITGSVPVVVPEAELDDDIWMPVDPDPATGIDDGPAPGEPTEVGTAGRPPRMLRNNLFVASGTAVSRLTGLVRTSLVFFLLADRLAGIYNTANITPNMIYELILGGVLTATLVPLFTDDLEHGDGKKATSAIISFALVAMLVTTALAALASPGLMYIFSRGAPPEIRSDYLQAAIPLALIFAPQVFFYGLMAVWAAVLNSRQRFLAAAWAPVLNNVVAIATLVVAARVVGTDPTLEDALADRTILWVLGIGTTAGIALMALALYPSIRRVGVRVGRPNFRHPAVRRAIRLSGWTFGYVIANQIAVVVIQTLAQDGDGDAISYQTAFQYFQLPHGLLAVSIMVTFEPLLGGADSRGDRRAFNDHLLLGFRLIGLLIIPAAVGYLALPAGLDHRTFEAVGRVGEALDLSGVIAAFAVGLPGFSTYLYVMRGFYAMKNTRTPFFINLFENAVNIVAAIVFVRLWGVIGLALAFSLAYSVAAVVAVGVLVRHSPGFQVGALVSTWLRLFVAAGVMGGFVYGVVYLMAPSSAIMLLPALAAGVAVGGIIYFATIYVLQVPGISELMTRLPVLKRFAT